ncbi:MAG: large conductance mechanosensitive channel protein MscL [Chloroflexota bacterium]|nr:large conductance mechanosensitive channel protein MscL [Chloroflexota bacterium]MDQ5865489.1 large conductance mechanosensitive channel protein MscL [Chloroflexota bacterium]
MFNEFKAFINRGNILELAVAVILATAFGAVIKSLVDNVIMPPIGALLGGVDFTNLYINLSNQAYASFDEALKAGAPVIGYGVFLNNVMTFLIVAFVVFLIVRSYNKTKPAPVAEVETKDCLFCFSTIPLQATRCPNCTSQLQSTSA